MIIITVIIIECVFNTNIVSVVSKSNWLFIRNYVYVRVAYYTDYHVAIGTNHVINFVVHISQVSRFKSFITPD